MIERLVPPSVACSETTGDIEVELFDVEREALGRAVEKRRREFVTGRACARQALRRLGTPGVAIPSGPQGEPLWPVGVVGSITHCRGYRACAVAHAGAVSALGIDAEPNEPLPDGVLAAVVHGRERDVVAGPPLAGDGGEPVHVPRLLFCIKEAVYKAWFPLTGRWLDFADVEVSLDPAASTFRARVLVAGPLVGHAPLTEIPGRWAAGDGIIGAAVALSPRGT